MIQIYVDSFLNCFTDPSCVHKAIALVWVIGNYSSKQEIFPNRKN